MLQFNYYNDAKVRSHEYIASFMKPWIMQMTVSAYPESAEEAYLQSTYGNEYTLNSCSSDGRILDLIEIFGPYDSSLIEKCALENDCINRLDIYGHWRLPAGNNLMCVEGIYGELLQIKIEADKLEKAHRKNEQPVKAWRANFLKDWKDIKEFAAVAFGHSVTGECMVTSVMVWPNNGSTAKVVIPRDISRHCSIDWRNRTLVPWIIKGQISGEVLWTYLMRLLDTGLSASNVTIALSSPSR